MNSNIISDNEIKEIFKNWNDYEFRKMFVYPYDNINDKDDYSNKATKYFLKLLNEIKK